MLSRFLALGAVFLVTACSVTHQTLQPEKEDTYHWYNVQVINDYPHQTDAFTQGLIYLDGYLYESNGRRGKSNLRKVDLESGEVLREIALGDSFFAEGLTDWNDWLIQLTYTSGRGFIYDKNSFELIGSFPYSGEGWGLTGNETHLFMSDGTDQIRILDPDTFTIVAVMAVTENGEPVERLNELEMVGDRLLANILFEEFLVVIDPESGKVTGRINLEGLLTEDEWNAGASVMNGIATDHETGRLFVTGKLWPRLFEINVEW